MANEQNLIPNSDRTPEELREQTRRGGIASGEARRAKKTLRERVKMFGELKIDGKAKRQMMEVGISEDDCDRFTQAAVSLFQKALKGDVSAFNAIRDIIGEKPIDRQQVEGTMETEVTVVFVDNGVRPVSREEDIPE